jgi:nucleotide-binding universal stress UspA family protein
MIPTMRKPSSSPHAGIYAAAARIGAGVVALGPGATAARVAHHASWAVLVARPSPAGGAVLGATDFSDPALPAIETAAREATRRGVPLRLLHAVDISLNALFSMPGPVMVPASPVDMTTALVDSARARLDESLRRFAVTGNTIVAQGGAAASITEAAATLPASLVVVGTRGRSGLPRLLLGSVADAVMRDAPCSVLAVPLNSTAEVP